MTNYEMIKQFSIENMVLTIMCPVDLGLMDECRCEESSDKYCAGCCLEWLMEESL